MLELIAIALLQLASFTATTEANPVPKTADTTPISITPTPTETEQGGGGWGGGVI
ncbi:hypothetical protein [Hymenobacter cellulosilyticus]|uniref:Uncharacterized protein n=1 Tax=Hymenobacter cellulosilyticus TaxID=2932248 RepID=A0A8T9Q5T9_9BACT|nr:hypothetical protein [Hymenobacter cellulosilyticus]UOQ72332.1 hypothetical protein MUN79_27950 [Hymenobacter cellulosilyticus]